MSSNRGFNIIQVPGDGNCLFHSVLRSLQHYNPDYLILGERIGNISREEFIKYLREYLEERILNQLIEITGMDITDEIVNSINNTCIYATDPTIVYLSYFLGININVYFRNHLGQIVIVEHNVRSDTTITIWYNGNNHYNAYLPVNSRNSDGVIEQEKISNKDSFILSIYLNILSNSKDNPRGYNKEKVLKELKLIFLDDDLVQALELEHLEEPSNIEYLKNLVFEYRNNTLALEIKLREEQKKNDREIAIALAEAENERKKQMEDDIAIAQALAGEKKYYKKYLKYKNKYLALKSHQIK